MCRDSKTHSAARPVYKGMCRDSKHTLSGAAGLQRNVQRLKNTLRGAAGPPAVATTTALIILDRQRVNDQGRQ
jgi:hypothetical protein